MSKKTANSKAHNSKNRNKWRKKSTKVQIRKSPRRNSKLIPEMKKKSPEKLTLCL